MLKISNIICSRIKTQSFEGKGSIKYRGSGSDEFVKAHPEVVIVDNGNDELPAKIVAPKVIMMGGDAQEIEAGYLEMSGRSTAKNAKAVNLGMYSESKITGSAEVEGDMTMSYDAKANNVKVGGILTLKEQSQILGTMDCLKLIDDRKPRKTT